ncbi:MAG: serine hydrolase [Ignavibacteria bacterium]|nr:serine hydrolase [Ignavibacteria bacterium]
MRLPAQSLYFPPLTGGAWETVSPASLGWDESKLAPLYDYLESSNTKAFIVLKDGRIAIEKYFGTFTADSNWYWASAGKTMTAMLVGIAQQEGFLSFNDPSSRWMGRGWTSLPAVKEDLITVRHQLTMTSGLDDGAGDEDCTLPSCLVYKADAGARWAYHNAPYTLLDSVMESATKMSLNQFYLSRMRTKTGMNGAYFRSGPYNNVLFTTPRSMARYGLLILNKGAWSTTPILRDTAYFRQMVTPSQDINNSYGYLWWLNGQKSHMLPKTQTVFPGWLCPNAPADMIAGLGKDGQLLNVVPSMGIVIVRMGRDPDDASLVPNRLNDQVWKRLNDVLRRTTDAEAPGRSSTESTSFLLQNYPNPFSTSTSISYDLPVGGHVSLTVYDMLGRTLEVLADGYEAAGRHMRMFSPNEASGSAQLYYYQLRTGAVVRSGAMIRTSTDR